MLDPRSTPINPASQSRIGSESIDNRRLEIELNESIEDQGSESIANHGSDNNLSETIEGQLSDVGGKIDIERS